VGHLLASIEVVAARGQLVHPYPSPKPGDQMDYLEILRRLAINDTSLVQMANSDAGLDGTTLGPKAVVEVRFAALVAVGGAVPSFGALADAGVGVGLTAREMVDILLAIIPVVGPPRVVAAAPNVALALGYDVEEVL
jgi:4-carboxymuconolactone decarboxylase